MIIFILATSLFSSCLAAFSLLRQSPILWTQQCQHHQRSGAVLKTFIVAGDCMSVRKDNIWGGAQGCLTIYPTKISARLWPNFAIVSNVRVPRLAQRLFHFVKKIAKGKSEVYFQIDLSQLIQLQLKVCSSILLYPSFLSNSY